MQLSLDVVGADHRNKDKSNRLFEILLSVPGEPVDLIPEPKNPVDPQAVAVFSCRGIQIGYIRAERAQLIRSYLSRGRITDAIFQAQATWGAIVRVGLDGDDAVLPIPAESPDAPPDFYPDYIPPDD
jgi:hypothetical protein